VRPCETQDPGGRRVVLTAGRWLHVIDGHEELAPLLDAVLSAVRHPDVITPDPRLGRWRYWLAGAGPGRWLFVVVDWGPPEPRIVTAFGKRKDPP